MDSTVEKQASDSLLVLTTESQLHAFDLSNTFRVAIGRHELNELQLESRTVSNFHAEILNENGRLTLRDLGSTNGTFVNDERIHEQRVASGDRIRIGSHVLTVLQKQAPISEHEWLLRVPRDLGAFGPGTTGRIVSIPSNDTHKTLQGGEPRELPLADLLKILTSNTHSVLLTLTQKDEQARVWVRTGRIVNAEYGSVTGAKALYRLFAWRNASYKVDDLSEEHSTPRTIELPVDCLIVEGMKHASEIGMLLGMLPPLDAPLQLREDCTLPPSAYTPAEFQIFRAVMRHETTARVLETSPMTDTTVLRLIEALVRKGVFHVARKADGRLVETKPLPQIRRPLRGALDA